MIAVIASSWTLFLGMAFIMLGNGLQGTLLGVRASLEGFSTATTGLVMTGYFVGFLAGSWLVPKFVRNVGHIRVFAALASLASISVLVHAIFVEPYLWGAMRLLTGFAYAGLYVVAESWLNEQASNETRGQLLSIYMIITMGSMACGQLLLNLSEPGSFELFVLVSMLVSLALVPISLTVVPAPAFAAPVTRVSIRSLYKASPLGAVGAFGVGTAHGVLFGMGAVFATQSGYSLSSVAYFMTSFIVGGVLLQWPIGWLSDHMDRRQVITLVALLGAALALLVALLAEQATVTLFIVTALFGGMTLPLYSLCIAHTNDYLESQQLLAASGTLVMLNGIGASMGPVSASLVMSVWGPRGMFFWLIIIHLAIGMFALYRMTRRASVPLEEQGAYIPVTSRSSPVAVGIAAEEAVEQAESAADD